VAFIQLDQPHLIISFLQIAILDQEKMVKQMMPQSGKNFFRRKGKALLNLGWINQDLLI